MYIFHITSGSIIINIPDASLTYLGCIGTPMRLTVFSDYSLRVLLYLGTHRENISTINEIAETYGISRNHLMKVVHALGRRGIIETLRGKGGGIRLRLDPHTVNLGTVVRATEADTALVECFDPEHTSCPIVPACALRGVLAEAREAFFRTLDRATLADLLGNEQHLLALMVTPPTSRISRKSA